MPFPGFQRKCSTVMLAAMLLFCQWSGPSPNLHAPSSVLLLHSPAAWAALPTQVAAVEAARDQNKMCQLGSRSEQLPASRQGGAQLLVQ